MVSIVAEHALESINDTDAAALSSKRRRRPGTRSAKG